MLAQNWEARCQTAITDQEKLDVIVEHLTEWHLDHFGGYPHDGMWIETTAGEKFIMADLDYRRRTELKVFTKVELLEWFEQARQLYKQWHEKEPNADISFSEVLLEVA
jgi:hypothetical protein